MAAYQAQAQANPRLSPKSLRKGLDQVRNLQGADVIVLDEIDDGVKRSGYYDVPRELSRLLHMNYAFAVEFVELNPLYLGARKMDTLDLPRQLRNGETFGVDPKRYLGLEGTAILSRYPIRNVRIVRLPEEYDWYHGEIGAISNLEKIEKWSAEKIFGERLARQVRRGGRIALLAELSVPGLPSGVLTVVCPHLEDYTGPKGRRAQMDFLLQEVSAISGPLLSVGDLNTLSRDGAPITPKRALKSYLADYKLWLREAVYLLAPIPGLSVALSAVNYWKDYHDPTALNVPIFASNAAEPLFKDIREFRFADGGAFDWAGSKKRSFQRRAHTLSDSNQRAWKGFSPTFSFHRTFHGIVGEYKIDWIFVRQVDDALLPYRGRTLCELNDGVGSPHFRSLPDHIEFRLPRITVCAKPYFSLESVLN